MLHDFSIFYAAGQALLHGQSPYLVAGYFYPYPATFLFALIALLPFNAAAGLWLLVSAAVLAAVTRRQAVLWFLFPPVIACLLQGQLDLLVLGLWALAGGTAAARPRGEVVPGLALALMLLKPQLAFIVIPYQLWQWRGTRRWISFAAGAALLYGLPTLLWPGWVGEFLAHSRPLAEAMTLAPSLFAITHFAGWLWPLALGLGAALVGWALRRGPGMVNAAALAANPTTHLYDLALLADRLPLWRTVALSWPLYLATLAFSRPDAVFWLNAPFALVALAALWERRRYFAPAPR